MQKGCNPSPPTAGWTCPLPPPTSIRVTSALSQKTTLFCVPQPTWPQDSLGVQHHGLDRLHTVCEGLPGRITQPSDRAAWFSGAAPGRLGCRLLRLGNGMKSSHTRDSCPCLDRSRDILVQGRLSGRGGDAGQAQWPRWGLGVAACGAPTMDSVPCPPLSPPAAAAGVRAGR